MSSIIADIRKAAQRRAAYNRTVSAISALPVEYAVEDLGVYPGDAHEIAYRAVYGG